jgi:hypothetical protein
MHAVKVMTVLVILLGVVIGSGIYSFRTLSSSSRVLENHINGIEYYSKAASWEKAKEGLSYFEKDWEKTEKSWAILLDHNEMDNIDASLSKIAKYIEAKDRALTLGEVAVLGLYVKHIPDKESFNIKNIL